MTKIRVGDMQPGWFGRLRCGCEAEFLAQESVMIAGEVMALMCITRPCGQRPHHPMTRMVGCPYTQDQRRGARPIRVGPNSKVAVDILAIELAKKFAS